MKFLINFLASFLILFIFQSTSNSQELHRFISKDPFNEKGEVETMKDISVGGVLYLPTGNAPHPAVILSNSSAGTEDKIQERLIFDFQKKDTQFSRYRVLQRAALLEELGLVKVL
jgi:hypothetical protein